MRRSIARLQREQRYRGEEATLIELTRRGEAVYPDLDGVSDVSYLFDDQEPALARAISDAFELDLR